MIGVILMSHGHMAEGLLNTCTMFYGDDIPQIKALCLEGEDNPLDYDDRIKEAIKEIDDGHGVIGFCDLFAGTPSNRCASMCNDRFQVITGMNFSAILEILGLRVAEQDISEIDIDSLIKVATNGIKSLNKEYNNLQNNSDDE